MTELTKKIYGSGTGAHSAYVLEARTIKGAGIKPHPCGMLISELWERVPIRVVTCDRPDHSGVGSASIVGDIPIEHYNCYMAYKLNMLDFDAAYAFAHVFIKQGGFASGIECRIVEVEISYSYETKHIQDGPPITLWGRTRSYFEPPEKDSVQ